MVDELPFLGAEGAKGAEMGGVERKGAQLHFFTGGNCFDRGRRPKRGK